MEAWRYLLPTEVHHCHKGRFHEESHDTLDSQRGAEDVAYEPGVVRPVGAKLELEDDTRGNTHGEVNSEEFLPEDSSIFPELLFRTIIDGLHDTHDDVIDCREGELRSRPVDGSGINV